MIDFMNTQPTAIKAGFGNTIFYYGVEPHGLSKLPTRSEFTLVYSPSQENGWEAVHYLVLHTDKTYFVVDRRDLQIHEIEHFEQLLSDPRNQFGGNFGSQHGLTFASSLGWTQLIEKYATAMREIVFPTIAPCPN